MYVITCILVEADLLPGSPFTQAQYSPDNLTLANSHAPLNSHACSGHNSAVHKNVM